MNYSEVTSERNFYNIINQLEFLSHVKKGDKISIKLNLVISPNLWFGPVIRYFLNHNRQNTLKDLIELNQDIIDIIREINTYFNLDKKNKYLQSLHSSIDCSLKGIDNLIDTYHDDSNTSYQLKQLKEKFTENLFRIDLYQKLYSNSTTQPINTNNSYHTKYPLSAPPSISNTSSFNNNNNTSDFDPSDLGIQNNNGLMKTIYYSTESLDNSILHK